MKQNVFYVNPEQTQYFVQVQISDKKTALKYILLYCVFVCLCVCMFIFSFLLTDMLFSLVQFSNQISIDTLDWLNEYVEIPIDKINTSFKITFKYQFSAVFFNE